MRNSSNNKVRKTNSKPKRPISTKNNYKISPNILANDETKKIYQKLNTYPNYKFIKQLNTEKLTLYLNNYSSIDINVITKILPKYLYFQQLTVGPFEPRPVQSANLQTNFNQQNLNYQKKRNSKSLGKVYKNTKQKESEKIQIKQKIFSAIQKHLSQTKNLLSLVIQSFKINQELAKYLSQGISDNKSLQYLSINYCVLSVESYESILKGILSHEIIRCIDLSNNKLNDKYSAMISRIIQRQSQRRDQIIWSYQLRNELPKDNNYKLGLISINLHGNQLGKKSAELISATLNNDQYIRYIDLSKNIFDNASCKLFVHMLRKNNTLLTVDLRENPGYDEFINPRIVMKMSKNIKYLYSQYQNSQYTEEEFEYLKGFIDISFFDVDIPQEIVEYYNTNVQQTSDENNLNLMNNNIQNTQNINNENININNINNVNNNNNNENINNENNNNINNMQIQEENEEEQAVIKNNEYNNNYNQNNNNNTNKIKSKKNNTNNKENKAYKENQKLIQENLQLKQEILELKAKNLQKMLSDGLVVPKEEEKDLENYYNRANEIIDTLNEVMAKLQQHKSGNNNTDNNINLNNYDLNKIKEKATNILKQNDIDNNKNDEQNEINNNNNSNDDKNKNNNIVQNNKLKNDTDNNNIINDNNNQNEKNNNINNINKNDNSNNINIENNINDKKNIENEKEKDIKEKEIKNNLEEKEKENNKEIEINNDNNENNRIINDEINNVNISDEEENDFNFDDLTEEEKIALIQQRELLMKLQEEAEARGEEFNIQEYLAQFEQQADEEEEEFGQQGQNDNKLNKSF